jgi:hypothetical protein
MSRFSELRSQSPLRPSSLIEAPERFSSGLLKEEPCRAHEHRRSVACPTEAFFTIGSWPHCHALSTTAFSNT